MSEWLDLMLEEIRRKQREAEEALAEAKRRSAEQADAEGSDADTQSK